MIGFRDNLFYCCKSTHCCLFVERRNIMACLLHHFNDSVEVYGMASVGESCIQVGVESSRCGVCVAFDTGNLHKPAHRVACESEVMFESHLR